VRIRIHAAWRGSVHALHGELLQVRLHDIGVEIRRARWSGHCARQGECDDEEAIHVFPFESGAAPKRGSPEKTATRH
jgi:hypothetical protein